MGTPGDWMAMSELATFAVRYKSEFPQAICSLPGPTPQSPPALFCRFNMGAEGGVSGITCKPRELESIVRELAAVQAHAFMKHGSNQF